MIGLRDVFNLFIKSWIFSLLLSFLIEVDSKSEELNPTRFVSSTSAPCTSIGMSIQQGPGLPWVERKIAFSIANSPLIKTAIAGEDHNWGRVIMAIGKSGENVNVKKLNIKFGEFSIIKNGELNSEYDEKIVQEYMGWDSIEINVEMNMGEGNYIAYTCDFTKEYIDINSDYRS